MNITNEQGGLTSDQLENLKTNAKTLVTHKNEITKRFNELVKNLQKIGYSVNPKTGHIKEL